MTWIQTLTNTDQRPPRQQQPLIMRLIDTMDRLDPERLEQVWSGPQQANISIEESLIRAGLADEHQIAHAYSEHYLLPLFDPPAEGTPPVDFQVASLLPARLCREHRIAPLADDGTTLEVAIFSPDSLWLADDLRLLTGRQMRPLFTPLSVIEKLLTLLYAEHADADPRWSLDRVEGPRPAADARDDELTDFGDAMAEVPGPSLEALELNARQRADLHAALQSPHGLMLVTGPRRSGRSTTFQACVNSLDKANICSIQSPVAPTPAASHLAASQQPVATALREWLREDPDVVAVDEIRDRQTAQICIRAALTGHFVISTLHCEDAFTGLTRLAEMELEPGAVAETLRGIVSQRTIRRLCTACRLPHRVAGRMARRYGLREGSTAYRAAGCTHCGGTGYHGSLTVFEVIRIDEKLSQLIGQRAPTEALQRAAVEAGMGLLPDGMAEAVAAGLTSFEEAMSVPPRRDRRGT